MIEHIPGKENVLADALSRSQAAANLSELSFVDEVEFCVAQSQSVHASQGKLHELSKLQKADEILALVRSFVLGSWPAYLTSNDVCLQPYFDNRSLISIQNDLLTMGDRIIIPQTKRVEILQTLHEGHLGITKCRDRARQIVWWPGISQQIAEMVRNCNTCRRHANKVHEPLMPAEFPKNPWQKVGSDLFYHGNQWYLLIVDYYSRFVEIAQLHDLSSKQVVIQLKSIFSRHGIPELLVSDNGPQYACVEFREFAQQYQFQHITSSPKHAQANGAAERAVQTVKSLLKKNSDPYLALLAYRTSPLENGLSPAELLMSRRLRTTLPTLPGLLEPQVNSRQAVENKEQKINERSKASYDHRHRARPLTPLQTGDKVFVTDMKTQATISRPLSETPRSYVYTENTQ